MGLFFCYIVASAFVSSVAGDDPSVTAAFPRASCMIDAISGFFGFKFRGFSSPFSMKKRLLSINCDSFSLPSSCTRNLATSLSSCNDGSCFKIASNAALTVTTTWVVSLTSSNDPIISNSFPKFVSGVPMGFWLMAFETIQA